MKRTFTVVALTLTFVMALASGASAFWCVNQDKKVGAGAVTEDGLTFNAAGRPVARGAFMTDGTTDIFIRGGEKHIEGPGDPSTQFGAIPHTALDQGNPDHGLTELEE